MICKLVLKDIYAFKSTIFGKILLLWLTFGTLVILRFGAFDLYVIHASMAIIFAVSVFSLIEKSHDTELLTNSLPVTRFDIVTARYLTTVVVLCAGMLIWLFLVYTLGSFYTDPSAENFKLSIVKALLLMVFMVIVHASIFLPAVFQFGITGSVITFCLAFITSIVLTAYVFQPKTTLLSPLIAESGFLWVALKFSLLIFGVFLSWQLSLRLYKNRDL